MCKCIWRLGPALVIFSSCSLLHFLSHGISLNLKLTRAARLPGLVRPGLPVGIPPTQLGGRHIPILPASVWPREFELMHIMCIYLLGLGPWPKGDIL